MDEKIKGVKKMPYKGKGHGPRIKDKLRKMIRWPGAPKSGTFSGGHGISAGSQVSTLPYKKKPARKGRPN